VGPWSYIQSSELPRTFSFSSCALLLGGVWERGETPGGVLAAGIEESPPDHRWIEMSVGHLVCRDVICRSLGERVVLSTSTIKIISEKRSRKEQAARRNMYTRS
jgi:hypothetical protein